MNFSILHWFHLMFGNHNNFFCHAVIVGNSNVKKVEWHLASTCFTWHIAWTLCMQPNFLLTGQVYPMLMSSLPHAWGTLDRKSILFKLIANFFLKGVVFMFCHDIVYTELLYCVTNFELVWTWNKVAVVENVRKCRLYPTFPSENKAWRTRHFSRCESPSLQFFSEQRPTNVLAQLVLHAT